MSAMSMCDCLPCRRIAALFNRQAAVLVRRECSKVRCAMLAWRLDRSPLVQQLKSVQRCRLGSYATV
jgi:hypothetical protein